MDWIVVHFHLVDIWRDGRETGAGNEVKGIYNPRIDERASERTKFGASTGVDGKWRTILVPGELTTGRAGAQWSGVYVGDLG